ncbi:MAG: outer membrane lipoprotein carrier protein LolA [Chitinophagales bacterium]
MKNLFLVLSIALATLSVRAQSADDVIKSYLGAIGGVDNIKKVQTMKAEGNFQQGGMNFPFIMYQKRPNSQLIEATFQGMTQKIAYDGTAGWVINPFQGRSNAEKMDADQAKQQKFEADIDGPFVDYVTKGYKIDFVGQEDIDGSPTNHLKLTTPDGDIRDYYFDKDASLLVKEKDHIKMQDGTTEDSETNFSDYKQVDGVLLPFTVENVNEYQGQKFSSFIKMDSVQHNLAVDDALFKMPDSTTPASTK